MIKDMKWFIWENDEKKHPLCWDDAVLEFDSQEAATRFLESVRNVEDREDMNYNNAIVDQAILFWDGGHINATNFEIVCDDENSEQILVNIKGE